MLIEQPQLRPEVSIRWLTIACFEIRVGDFRIVIDPCIGYSPPCALPGAAAATYRPPIPHYACRFHLSNPFFPFAEPQYP